MISLPAPIVEIVVLSLLRQLTFLTIVGIPND